VRRQSGKFGREENERRRGKQKLRGWAPRSRNPCSSPRPPSWHPRKRSENAVCFLPVSLLSFLWGAFYLLGTGLGGWQRKACNVPPSRGQRRGNGQKKNVRRHSLDRLHASMIKQKKKHHSCTYVHTLSVVRTTALSRPLLLSHSSARACDRCFEHWQWHQISKLRSLMNGLSFH